MTSIRGLAYALAAAMLAIAIAPTPLRVPGAVALVLVLPGLVLVHLARPRGWLERGEAVLGVLALSLAVAVISGLVVGALGVPLARASFALCLGGLCAAGLGVAAHVAPARGGAPVALPSFSRASAAWSVAALVGVAAAIGIGVALQRSHSPGFTQLWVLRGTNASTVQVGVNSHEKEASVYRLRVSVGGRSRAALVQLRPGQRWLVSGPLPRQRGVTVTLVKLGTPGIYRRVHLARAGS